MNSLLIAATIMGMVVKPEPGGIITEDSVEAILQVCEQYQLPIVDITRNDDGGIIQVECKPAEIKPGEILS